MGRRWRRRGGFRGGHPPETFYFSLGKFYIVYHPSNMGKMEYDNWQKQIMLAKGDLLANTGRQVGKTTVFSHKIAEYLIAHKKHQVIVVSLTEDQAQLIIVMILDYLQKHFKDIIQKGNNKPTKSRV